MTIAAAAGNETDCTAAPALTVTADYNDDCTGVDLNSSSTVTANAFSSFGVTLPSSSYTLTGPSVDDVTELLDAKAIILSSDGTS